jgi:hypothetical protein
MVRQCVLESALMKHISSAPCLLANFPFHLQISDLNKAMLYLLPYGIFNKVRFSYLTSNTRFIATQIG